VLLERRKRHVPSLAGLLVHGLMVAGPAATVGEIEKPAGKGGLQ
jgi:hypothetical protein